MNLLIHVLDMIPAMLRNLSIIVFLVLGATVARASELSVSFEALARNITLQLMTDGRYYMQGDPSTPCRYAFVQDPRVDAMGGRLRIRLLFSGKAGVNVGGRCVGGCDNFDLEISGVPAYANGELYLDQRTVQATAAYFTAVSTFVQSRLERDLRVPLEKDLARAAAWLTSSGRGVLDLAALEVHDVAVEANAIRFTYDITTSLR